MGDQFSDLLGYWKAQKIVLSPGNSQRTLTEFEEKHGVTLSPDLRDYYSMTNGMPNLPGSDCDRNGFRFWPLSDVAAVPTVCAGNGVPLPEIELIEQYFVFADYLQWSWAYAIKVGPADINDHPVIHIGTLRPKMIASSFRAFVNLYLADDREIYVT